MNRKSTQHPKQSKIAQSEIGPVFESCVQWLETVISLRLKSYFNDENGNEQFDFESVPLPALTGDTPFERRLQEWELSPAEILLILLAMAPLLKPQILDIFFTKNTLLDRGFTEFGGIKGETHGGFMPTAETAIFLLCSNDIAKRLEFRTLFLPSHRLFRQQVLLFPVKITGETEFSYPLQLSDEYRQYFFSGESNKSEYNPSFPAKLLETKLAWEDLVVDQNTLEDLLEIQSWVNHGDHLLEKWGMDKVVKPGFRSLFYGPPGTGKSLAATLLGKITGKEVYRIDLSMVVSKYIGETEKNLGSVFDQAQEKNWILFFDEADALFGKRTQTTSSNDRYANQEVSYLLQRIEDFPGTIILATNLKNNMDSAFSRRFQSVIQFLKPDKTQRLRLWQLAFSNEIPVDKDLDLEKLSGLYELTGGEIINVIRHAALQAIQSTEQKVTLAHILGGIKREFTKDGRMFDQWPEDH